MKAQLTFHPRIFDSTITASMKITRLLLTLLLLWTLSPAQAQPADFVLKNIAGENIALSSFRGRWVVINFWATWCAPCIKEIPELISFQDKYSKIQVVGINFEQQTPVQLRTFLKKFNINYPQLMVKDTPLVPFEPLKGLPTTAVVDPSGVMVSKHTGPVTVEMLENFFRREKVIPDPKAEQRAREAAEAKAKAEAEAKARAKAKAAAKAKAKAAAEAKAKAAARAKAKAKARAAAKAKARAKARAAAKAKARAKAKAAAKAKAQAKKKAEAAAAAKKAAAKTGTSSATQGNGKK